MWGGCGNLRSKTAPFGFPDCGPERKNTMNFLQIIQTILSVAPSGIQLTQEVVALVQAIEAAFTAGQTPASHQQAVASALGAHLAKQ
jgi:hypothetical protein